VSAPGSPLANVPLSPIYGEGEGAGALPAPDRAMSLAARLIVVNELMRALELVTQAGQQHVMNKILAILRREMLLVAAPFAAPALACLRQAMAELEHEAGRIAPTAAAFNRHARVIIGVLEQS
jgi:hypothetical protein